MIVRLVLTRPRGAAYALIVGLLALAAAGQIDLLWPYNALISFIAPALLIAVLGFGALLVLAGERQPLLIMGILLSAALLFWEFWPGPSRNLHIVGQHRQSLRVIEFNAWNRNKDPRSAIHWILAQRPDVVVLLEAAGRGGAIAEGLREALPYRASCRGARPCSTLILSRIRPVRVQGLAHGDADNRRTLSAVVARFDHPLTPATFVAVHLSRPLPPGRQAREIDQLVAELAQAPRDRLIVAGDFNAPGWSMPLRHLRYALDLTTAGRDQPTWPAAPAGLAMPLLLPLDHVLLGKGWRATAMRAGPALGSDHLPLLVDLERSDRHDGA